MLKDNGVNPELAPTIQIIDSEMTEMSMKIELVNTLFGKLNCSYETAYETLGMSMEDEKIRRIKENDEELEEVFAPRLTPYTVSGNTGYTGNGTGQRRYYRRGTGTQNVNWNVNHNGRPPAADSLDPDKQSYDKELYRTKSSGE